MMILLLQLVRQYVDNYLGDYSQPNWLLWNDSLRLKHILSWLKQIVIIRYIVSLLKSVEVISVNMKISWLCAGVCNMNCSLCNILWYFSPFEIFGPCLFLGVFYSEVTRPVLLVQWHRGPDTWGPVKSTKKNIPTHWSRQGRWNG